jgi:hypothetical protein
MEYHLFVSYSHRDEAEVLKIVRDLRAAGLNVWVDSDGNLLGKRLNEEFERLMRASMAIGVFIGGSGMGEYHRDEQNAALALAGRSAVFPVILPSTPFEAEIPAFLANRGGVDFRGRAYDTVIERMVRQLQQISRDRTPMPAASQRASENSEAAEKDDGEDDPFFEEAVSEIADGLEERPPTIFVGSRFPVQGTGFPPTSCHVAHVLLKQLGIVSSDPAEKHAGVLPALETAGRYYAAAVGAPKLERDFRVPYRGATRSPTLYAVLIRLLKRILADMQKRRTSPLAAADAPMQLVVTTCTDVSLERELVAAKVPFTRVVMNRSGSRVQVNPVEMYAEDANGLTLITGKDCKTPIRFEPGGGALCREDIDLAIGQHAVRFYVRGIGDDLSFPLEDLPAYLGARSRPTPLVLYKHHGSQDVQDSCAVSTDQYFELASAPAVVPSAISSRIANTPSLIVGYSPLDADFRQLYYTVLQRLFDSGTMGLNRYMVQSAPDPDRDDPCRFGTESLIWRKVKGRTRLDMKLNLVDVSAEEFLDELMERLQVGAP